MNTYELKHDWSLTFCVVLYLVFWYLNISFLQSMEILNKKREIWSYHHIEILYKYNLDFFFHNSFGEKKVVFAFLKVFWGGGIWQFFSPQKFNMQQFSFYYIFFIIKIWAGEHTVKFSFLSILHIFEQEETACIYEIHIHTSLQYESLLNLLLMYTCGQFLWTGCGCGSLFALLFK